MQSRARQDVTLKALEIFQVCAREGSFQAAAQRTGLSISTISHHMGVLERNLGVALFNHARRPMNLTPTGRTFLRNIDTALTALRRAKAEASAGTATEASRLRIGALEDFDSDVTPDLAAHLNAQMPRCEFSYHTDTSHALLGMLRHHDLDLGVTTLPTERVQDLQVAPLLKDPFVMVLPANSDAAPEQVLAATDRLPFLRFSGNLIISRQIDAQLRRLGLAPPVRFESDNSQTLMAMVATGAGWTITTPMLYSRARRFQPRLRLHAFPGRRFARTLAVVATPDCPGSVRQLIDTQIRTLITEYAITPVTQAAPWLEGQFALVN